MSALSLAQLTFEKGLNFYWRTPVNIEYALLVYYIKLTLNGKWHGRRTIQRDFWQDDFIAQYFDNLDPTEELQYGDVVILLEHNPYRYFIFLDNEHVLEQDDPATTQQQVRRQESGIRAIIDKELAAGRTVRLLRPLNDTYIFVGNREDESLDSDSHLDYPSVHLVRRKFSELGGAYRGDFTFTGDYVSPLDVLPTTSPDDRFIHGLIKPGDFVVVSERTDGFALEATGQRWQLKRFYRAVQVGDSTDPASDSSGAIQWVSDAWVDDVQGLNLLDFIKQNKLIAGTAMELIPTYLEDGVTIDPNGPVIVNWTGDPGIEAFLIPVDSSATPSVRTWQVWVSGNRAVGDEELMGYAVNARNHKITQINAGAYDDNTGATIYTFDNNSGHTFILSRNLEQNIGDALDFSHDQVVWARTKVDAYTRAETDALLAEVYLFFNQKIQAITDIINNWGNLGPSDKIMTGNININAIDYPGKGIFSHDINTRVQGDIDAAPTVPPSLGG